MSPLSSPKQALVDHFNSTLGQVADEHPGTRLSASGLQKTLHASDGDIESLIAGAIFDGRLKPVDVYRCDECRKQPEGAFDPEDFECDECGGTALRRYRLYSLTDRASPKKAHRPLLILAISVILMKAMQRVGRALKESKTGSPRSPIS